MSDVRRSCTLAVGALSALCLVEIAAADSGAQAPAPPSTVFFGSLDGGSSSGFASAGFKAALNGRLDEPGWFVMGTAGAGTYRYRTLAVPGGEVTGWSSEAALMIGRQWRFGPTIVGLFLGPEFQHQSLDPPDPGNSDRGARFGLRGQAEFWSHPTEATLVYGTLVAGSVGRVWARLAAGARIHERVFVGPELTAYANATYNETRFGAHATGVALGPLTLRLSGGLVLTGDGDTGAYGGLSGYIRY